MLSFSGVLRIPKGWRRVHISRSWEACSFPLKHSGLPSYLLLCVRFWQNIACVLQTLHQQTRIKNLKDHFILFSEFRMEMITSAFDFAYNFGWREDYPRFFFFFWFYFSARSFRYVDFKDGGAGRGCFYFSNAGSETTSNLLMCTGFPLAGSGFYVSCFSPNSWWKTATHILPLRRCIWK